MATGPFPFARRLAIAAGGVFAILGAGACAHAGPYNPDDLPAAQVASVNDDCRSVMGLRPDTANYGACVDSLMASARRFDRGEALQSGREACLNKGLRPDGPGFSVCELEAARDRPARMTGADAAEIAAVAEPGGPKSYAYASPDIVYRREQLSCARLGLDPASRAFGVCVAGLQSALFAADNPAQ